jgi:hypothetical protein
MSRLGDGKIYARKAVISGQGDSFRQTGANTYCTGVKVRIHEIFLWYATFEVTG